MRRAAARLGAEAASRESGSRNLRGIERRFNALSFLTRVTYRTWLPGDARGRVEHRRGWQFPNPIRKLEAKAKMTEDACILSADQRKCVESQIAKTCAFRQWTLHAVDCRSNHVHVVVAARVYEFKKVRIDLKAWTTRTLKLKFDPHRENWWAERGDIRVLHSEDEPSRAIEYVRERQEFGQ